MRNYLLSVLIRFQNEQSGSIAILSVAAIVIMAGMAGLVIDVGIARSEKNYLLTVAEASAIAAAASYSSSTRTDDSRKAAKSYAVKNYPSVSNIVSDNNIEFGKWKDKKFTAGSDVNAVRVTASRTASKANAVKTIFAGIFGTEFWDLTTSAVALVDNNPVCILVLHPNHSDAFDVDPDAVIDAPECQIYVNSVNKGALELGARSHVSVSQVKVVGGVDKSTTAYVNPTPAIGSLPMADPFVSLTAPSNNICGGVSEISGGTITIIPKYAFCNGLVIDKATVTFSPGVYVIKKPFTLKNGAHIKGQGVLIYLEGKGSDIFFDSKTSFDLKAPTSGIYAGMVLWSDRRNTNDHDIYSKFGASAEGTIYAPSSQVEFENNVVWETSCIRIVVSRLELDNKSKYKSSDPSNKCGNNLLSKSITLVN